jgi:hypothetical protein
MNFNWLKTDKAWQPFTFRGCSRFADSSFPRLFFWESLLAVVTATILVWFLDRCWFPVMDQASANFPEVAHIHNGRLLPESLSSESLAANRFLALLLDPHHSGKVRGPAHIQIEAGAAGLRFISLFGHVDWPYPVRTEEIEVQRSVVGPWWGAWRAPLLWIVFAGTCVGLMITWWTLSLIYLVPAWLLARCCDRDLKFFRTWKLCAAALLPGALCMIVGLILYSLGAIGLIEVLAIQVVHWVVGIVFCWGGVMRRPLASQEASMENPFHTENEGSEKPSKSENPFRSTGN